jgi:serine/threonine protein kinase
LTKKPTFETLSLLSRYVSDPTFFPVLELQLHKVTDSGQDFLRSVMMSKPDIRLSASGALQHPWIAHYLAENHTPTMQASLPRGLSHPNSVIPEPTMDSLIGPMGSWNTMSSQNTVTTIPSASIFRGTPLEYPSTERYVATQNPQTIMPSSGSRGNCVSSFKCSSCGCRGFCRVTCTTSWCSRFRSLYRSRVEREKLGR